MTELPSGESQPQRPPDGAPASAPPLMMRRFRGFLPVVVDVETGGFHAATDALLQIAAVIVELDAGGRLYRGATHSYHVRPFENARLDPASLLVNKIDPWHPLRPAIDEAEALQRIFREVRAAIRAQGCRRAVLVGHNASFDLAFLNAAVTRTGIKRNPFHPFSSFDTVTLAGAALGQTVLAKAAVVAGLGWDKASAHSASYDAERTAELFCLICNELAGSFERAEAEARRLGWQAQNFTAADPEID
jgi:ribonuclease T